MFYVSAFYELELSALFSTFFLSLNNFFTLADIRFANMRKMKEIAAEKDFFC